MSEAFIHLWNFLYRVWTDLLSGFGTTTLTIVLWLIIWLGDILIKFKRGGFNMISLKAAFRKPYLSNKYKIKLTAIVLIILFGWFVVTGVCNDHKSLVGKNDILNKTLSKQEKNILDKDIEIKRLKTKLSNVKIVDDAPTQKDQKKRKILDTLANFLSRATVLQNQCWGIGPALPPGKNTYQVYSDWHQEVCAYIEKKLGYSYRVRMIDSLSVLVPDPGVGMSEINKKTWILTEQSKVRLRELINKLE